MNNRQLRVGLLAGTLGVGGAEKQLSYIARALTMCGIEVRVFSLTNLEWYQAWLEKNGIKVVWVGQKESPILRIAIILKQLKDWRPDFFFSTHFFTNIYAGIVGKILGITTIGSLRGDVQFEIDNNPGWAGLLLRITDVLIANSYQSRRNALARGIKPSRLFVLPNVLDLDEFDEVADNYPVMVPFPDKVKIAVVCRLIPVKRIDRFLRWLSIIRTANRDVVGVIIGEGPEKTRLEELARQMGLVPDGLVFLGQRENVPAILRQCQMLALTSDHEGFPNVIIEGMASHLPIITRPVGDAARIVFNGVNGYVVPESEENQMLERVSALCEDRNGQHRMGNAGRRMVEELFNASNLPKMMLSILDEISHRDKNEKSVTLVQAYLKPYRNIDILSG